MTETIKDSFATEAFCFVKQWDALNLVGRRNFADHPSPEEVRPLRSHSWYFKVQSSNPFRDFTPADLWVCALADAFRLWCGDPGNPRWWDEMFGARWQLHDSDEYPWNIPDERR